MENGTYRQMYEMFKCSTFQKRHCRSKHPSRSSTVFHKLSVLLQIPTVHASNDSEPQTTQPLPELRKPKLMITDEEIQDYLSKETPMDRVKAMFQKDFQDKLHPDIVFALGVAKGAGLGTFMVMSVFGAIQAKEEFIRTHRHVKFATKFKATRAYQDAIFLGGLKTGLAVGFRAFIFCSVFITSATCVANYRNKTSPVEYSIGGALAGSFFKINMGLKGTVAGAVIGGVLGLVGGFLIAGALHASGDAQHLRHNRNIEAFLLHKKESDLLAKGQLSREDAQTLHILHKH